MRRESCLLLAVMCAVIGVVIAAAEDIPGSHGAASWQIPAGAAIEQQNPLPRGPALVAHGARLYAGHCEECHGRTLASRAPDGVLFYQIWNGRTADAMPAFRDRLRREDVWALVAYLKSLPALPRP